MGSPQQPQATPGLLGARRSLTKRARTAGSTELFATSDRYDELPASVIGKSLYQSNNLEQFRSHAERAANEYSHPSWLRGGPALSDDSASTAGRFRILGVAGQMADRKRELETFDQQAPKGHLYGALRAALR